MKLSDLKKPKNHKDLIGQPMLFAVMPTAKLKTGGEAKIQYNILTGDFFVTGQNERVTPYVINNISNAIKLAKTINHYNETGDKVPFKTGSINELELV